MIFQDPLASLNPVYTVGDQIGETLRIHRKMSRSQAREEAVRLLDHVGIPSSRRRLDAYPHELSGGMRQRVMIAIAISCQPKILIADEATTALDVTIQDQILTLLLDLQREKRRRSSSSRTTSASSLSRATTSGDVCGLRRRTGEHGGTLRAAPAPVHGCAAEGPARAGR